MSDHKQPVDKRDKKAEHIKEQRAVHRAATGIGGGLVGAAIGGLLGRRAGGVFGAVVGAAAGALVGKGTAERVNRTVEGVVDAAKSVAEGVNHTVKDVGDSAKSVAEGVNHAVKDVGNGIKSVADGVNHTVKDVGNGIKDTVEEVKPSVVGVVDAVKDTVEEVKSSVVGVAESVAGSVNHTVKGLQDTADGIAEEVKPSVVGLGDTVKGATDDVNPSDNYNSKLGEEQLVSYSLTNSNHRIITTTSQEHPLSNDVDEQAHQRLNDLQQSKNLKEIDTKLIKDKNLTQRQEQFNRNQQKTAQRLKQPKTKLKTEKKQKFTGIIVIVGAASITWIGLILGFSHKPKLLETKSPTSNPTLSSNTELVETKAPAFNQNLSSNANLLGTKSPTSNQNLSFKPETIADGWIFIGSINNISASALSGKSLIEGSQSTNSSVVPSIGSIVTVTASPGVTLRKNRPQEPNVNYKEQKALAILKPSDKLKILKVESVTPPNTTRPVTKVWAEVHRCGKVCN